jgi:benzoate membrane transport protein
VLKDLSAPAIAAGLLAAFVGFASSFAVILQGLTAMGATQAQAASGLMALSVAMGVGGIVLSLRTRQPISVVWSTPGAALLASSAAQAGGFPAAVGAFLIANALILAAGLWRPFGRAVAAIPKPLANAMLAGVLLGLCLAPVRAVAQAPTVALPVVLARAAVARFKRVYAVPAAVAVCVAALALTGGAHPGAAAGAPWARAVLIVPAFTVPGAIGIALPLFLVTMASQNIPGIAVLHANG